jgi:peroxiredoxin
MSDTYADPDLELLLQYRDAEGALSERLAAFSDAHRARHPAYSRAVDVLVARLEVADGWKHAPQVGASMPSAVLPDAAGRLIDLQTVYADGPVAIMFHRGHWCPYCRLNISAVAGRSADIAAAGGRVVVVTPERQRYVAKLSAEASGRLLMLTDIDNGYAMSLNLAVWLGPDIVRIFERSSIDLPKYHGNDAWMVPIPATFVVGRDGKVVSRFIDPDFRKRMELDDLLAAFRAAR